MKKSILVTGVAGSGKSTICKELKKQGYKTYSIEDMKDMFKMIRKDTGEDFVGFNNEDVNKVKNADWICDIKKLKKLIENESSETTFYCGTASNIEEILSLFDLVVLLKITSEVLRERLSFRKSGDFGKITEVQDWVLSWKDWWEDEMQNKGAMIIDGNGTPEEVTRKILEVVRRK